jgi:hypothetical protein
MPPLVRVDREKTNKLRSRELEDHITSPLDLVAFQEMADKRHHDRIHVSYLRGGRWVPARVGALGLEHGVLLTSVLPRLDEHVDVALSFGDRRSIVRGVVTKVSSPSAPTSLGVAVFTLRFALNEHTRRQLTALLVAARDAKITIKPPPRRASSRFPVEWLVRLDTTKSGVRARAIDVSVGGMFVCPDAPLLLDSTPRFSMVLDDGGPPVAGRARVVRRISDPEAKACGLVAGYGLAIDDMAEADRKRWLGFLARVEPRPRGASRIG